MPHMSIVKLSSSATAQIKSSVVINSLNDVVIGLIKNCIDAQAATINIHIDYTKGSCTVEDNGSGIIPSEFGADRGLAKLHYSSRLTETFSEIQCHGTYGRFLYSVAALSTMTIISKHRQYHSIGVLTIKESSVITRETLVSSKTQLLYKAGTKVAIQDLFSSMPVRMKHRTKECAEIVNLKRQYSGLIRSITALLLAWGSAITIAIAEVRIGDVLCIRSTRSRRCQSQPLNAFVSVLYQARLISTPEKASWIPVEASNQKMKVYGAISLQAAPTRNTQFLSMKVIPIENANSFSLLYTAINQCFDNSAFGSHEPANVSPLTDSSTQHLHDIAQTSRYVELEKGIYRSPMFHLRIDVRQHYGHDFAKGVEHKDDLIEQAALLQEICDFLHIVCTNFLRKQCLRPTHTGEGSWRKSSTAKSQVLDPLQYEAMSQPIYNQDHQQLKSILKPSRNKLRDIGSSVTLPSFKSDRRLQSTEHLPGWSTMRSGLMKVSKACLSGISTSQKTLATSSACAEPAPQPMSDIPAKGLPSLDQTQAMTALRGMSVPISNVIKSGQLLRQPFSDTTNTQPSCNSGSVSRNGQHNNISTDSEKAALIWVDPFTKLKSIIDPLTGSEVHEVHNRPDNVTVRRLSPISINRVIVNSTQPAWLVKSLKEWQNPVFQPTEVSIPQVSATRLDHICKSHCSQNDIAQVLKSSSERIANISKQALQQARVIAQVDRKFILINVNSGDGSGLVLVDQHAADERRRVEQLLEELCQTQCVGSDYIETLKLDNPILLELQAVESRQLDLIKDYFHRWGICFRKLSTIESTTLGVGRFQVTHLPSAILKRCVLSSSLLISLIRSELPNRHENQKSTVHRNCPSIDSKDINSHDIDEAHSWLSRIHDCPKGILDIINSRACRSAIMFNDELSLKQCQDLISRLAKCAFPFQCAHGRPSMVPLVDLASLGALSKV